MMRKLKLQAAANVTPVRAMSCTRAEHREVACAAQAEGESSSRDDERTEAAGGGESVTPVRATSWNAPNSARRPVPPKPRARRP
jgi:hypothetical protein